MFRIGHNEMVILIPPITYVHNIADVTRKEVEEHTGEDKFSCQCVAVTEDQQTHRSEKAYVAIACKSNQIICLSRLIMLIPDLHLKLF